MSTDDKNETSPGEKSQGRFGLLVEQFGIPFVFLLLGLILEYHSGQFQTGTESSSWTALLVALRRLTTVGLIAVFFGFMWSAWVAMRCWFLMHKHFRETFALKSWFALIGLVAVLILSLVSGFMPWSIAVAIGPLLLDQPLPSLSPPAEAYILLFVLYMFLFALPFIAYNRWNGMKSEQQHWNEEHDKPQSLLRDGRAEWRRILRRGPPLTLHVKQPAASPFESELLWSEPKPWKDAALELWGMDNRSFEFERDQGWHEPPGCWIGVHRHTGEMIVLYPVQTVVADDELKELSSYVNRLSTAKSQQCLQIVVVLREHQICPSIKMDGRTIRFETETSMIDRLLDLGDYRNEIRRRVEQLPLPDSDLTLRDVFVPSKYTSIDGQDPEDVEPFLLRWLDDPGTRQLVLLGEYGQGKSTTALLFTYHLLCCKEEIPKRIPLLIELRGAAPSGNINNTLGLLGAWAVNYDLKPKLLGLLNEAGRLVLIFEGFDELSQVGDPEARYLHFSALWRFRTPRSKLLFTGRPNLFRGDDEMERALGLKGHSYGGEAHCDALRLSFFNVEQIAEALRNYSQVAREQICELALLNPNFRDLVARPSLLHIVATLWEQERLGEQVDRLNSAFVMDLFIRKSYRRPGRKQNAADEFIVLTTLERIYFMHGIAAYMIAKRQLPNQIEARQLDKLVDRLIEVIPPSISASSSATSGETTDPLKYRIDQIPYGHEQVRSDVRTYGLLVDDPASIGTFKFAHKSFMEYLFAAVAADYIKDDESYRTELAHAVMKATGAQIEDVMQPWATVCIEFLADILATEDQDSVHPPSQSNNRDGERRQELIATRLLQTLINKGKPLSKQQRLALLLWIPARIRDIRMGLTVIVVVAALVATSVVIAWSAKNFLVTVSLQLTSSDFQQLANGNAHQSNEVFLKLMWAMMVGSWPIFLVGLVMFLTSLYLARLTIRYRTKIRLWLRLCRHLGIENRILHRVSGTHRFVRNPDELFIYDPEKP